MSGLLAMGTAVAGLLAFVGIWALAARPGDALNRALFAYLVLSAGLLVVFGFARSAGSLTTTRLILWFDIPQFLLVPFILDEMLLTKPRSRWRAGVLAALAAVTGGLLLALVAAPHLYHAPGPAGSGGFAPQALHHAYAFGNDAVHALAALGAGFIATRADRSPLQRRQAALVGAGFACLALHSVATLVGNLPFLQLGLLRLSVSFVDPVQLLGLLAVPAVPWVLAPFVGRARRTLVAALTLAGAFGVTQGAMDWLSSLPGLSAFEVFARGSRLVVLAELAMFLALAVLRFGAAGVNVDARPRLAAATRVVLVGALATGLAGIALAAVGPGLPALPLLLGALLVPLALRRPLGAAAAVLTDRLLLPPGDPGLTRERARIYASALRAAAFERGEVPGPDDPDLAALRARLGLRRRDHALLASAVDPRGDALAEGELLLARYRTVRELGRGTFGQVFLAHDTREGRDVVLKRLLGKEHRDAAALRRLRREAHLAGAVEHPHIVAVHDVEVAGEDTYLVMEYLPGGSLADRMRKGGPLPEADAVRIGLDVLSALEALHSRGVVHRDVKPANVLLDAQGRAKLGDFTIARELVSGDTLGPGGARGAVGTFPYLAPEQARGLASGPQADLYGLGATLYEAIAGRPILDVEELGFVEAAARVVRDAPSLPVPRASPAVSDALARALEKAPEDRFRDAASMAAALRAALPRGPPSP